MICGQGEQLIGSFHCIQSWCQYSAGSPGSLVRRMIPPVLAKSPRPICSRARRVAGQSSSFWMVEFSAPLRGDVLALVLDIGWRHPVFHHALGFDSKFLQKGFTEDIVNHAETVTHQLLAFFKGFVRGSWDPRKMW